MRKHLIFALFALAVPATPCFALTWKFIHAKYFIIGNGAPPPITRGNDIGGFGGDTIGGFGGENVGGLP